MRERDVWTPVLLTADGEYDEADAFDLGADDYLTKLLRGPGGTGCGHCPGGARPRAPWCSRPDT